MRNKDGAFKSKPNSAGETCHYHRLTGAVSYNVSDKASDKASAASEVEIADAATLHAVYAALLDRLKLYPEHTEQLHKRGLIDQAIAELQYRSLPKDASVRGVVAGEMAERFGEATLARVPGFVRTEKGWRLAGKGLLIPVRGGVDGKIGALLIRRDAGAHGADGGAAKYVWLSSKKHGGPSPGSPVHAPKGTPTASETVRIVEGILKADVVSQLDKTIPCLGIPGCGQWAGALPILRALGAKVVRLAFDADWREKDSVADALRSCAAGLVKEGFAVECEVWPDSAGKGLDDVLAAGKGETVCVLPTDKLGIGVPTEQAEKISQAARLLALASAELELFHAPDGTGYARTKAAPRQTFKLSSGAGKRWLRHRSYEEDGVVPNPATLTEVAEHLDGLANIVGEEREVYLRVAGANVISAPNNKASANDGKTYIDLGAKDWRAVQLDSAGWNIAEDAPLHFRRANGMMALPEPQRGGRLAELKRFINIGTEEDFRLLVAWLTACCRPTGPFPLLCLHGEQGSAKSSTAKVLRSLIDPNAAPLRAEPREVQDLMIAANGSWVLVFDNLSHLTPSLSDALCGLSTGRGFSTRRLFTDEEEQIFQACRPVLLTSIVDIAKREDLLDRAIILRLPTIPEEKRQAESELWPAFEQARPQLLGALLDLVAGAMRELPNVKLASKPRMADFAMWGTAVERAAGWPEGSFMRAYLENIEEATSIALDSLLPEKLRELVRPAIKTKGEYKETAGQMLEDLNTLAGDASRSREWPKSANVLSAALKRLAPALRRYKSDPLDVAFIKEGRDKERKRFIVIKPIKPASEGTEPSAPEAPPAAPCAEAPERTESGDDPQKPSSPGSSPPGTDKIPMPCGFNPTGDGGRWGRSFLNPCNGGGDEPQQGGTEGNPSDLNSKEKETIVPTVPTVPTGNAVAENPHGIAVVSDAGWGRSSDRGSSPDRPRIVPAVDGEQKHENEAAGAIVPTVPAASGALVVDAEMAPEAFAGLLGFDKEMEKP